MQYTPDAMRILANIQAGTYCRDCGVPATDAHLDVCPRYGMPNLLRARVLDYGMADRAGTVTGDTGNHCVTVAWDRPHPYGQAEQEVSRHRLTVVA